MSAKKTSEGAPNEELRKKGAEGQLEKLQKPVTYAMGAIVIIIAGFLGYQRFVQDPNTASAIELSYRAQEYFEMDSLDQALNGDGSNEGFLDIIDQYGSTKIGKLANFYAGMCYLKMGNAAANDSTGSASQHFEDAVTYLKKFNTSSALLGPLGEGRLGDAYSELGQYDNAISSYEKAVKVDKNDLTTPEFLVKLGFTCLETEAYTKAAAAFTRVKDEYPASDQARQVDRYIAMAEAQSK